MKSRTGKETNDFFLTYTSRKRKTFILVNQNSDRFSKLEEPIKKFPTHHLSWKIALGLLYKPYPTDTFLLDVE